jgi:hypothetical protein
MFRWTHGGAFVFIALPTRMPKRQALRRVLAVEGAWGEVDQSLWPAWCHTLRLVVPRLDEPSTDRLNLSWREQGCGTHWRHSTATFGAPDRQKHGDHVDTNGVFPVGDW